jgi:hypothetical protein
VLPRVPTLGNGKQWSWLIKIECAVENGKHAAQMEMETVSFSIFFLVSYFPILITIFYVQIAAPLVLHSGITMVLFVSIMPSDHPPFRIGIVPNCCLLSDVVRIEWHANWQF